MKFLSVLCVVLYLRSEVSTHAYNNENAQYYNNFNPEGVGSVQSNIAPNSGINWQIQAEEKERNRLINRRQFNSREDSRRELLNNSPEYDNLQRKIHLNEASIGSNNIVQQQGFHQDQILPSYVNPYQDTRGNEQEANRRENVLQGFPSNYVRHQPIQNMNTQPLRAQEYVSSSMLNDARLINKHNQNEPHFISRDISRPSLSLRDISSDQTQLVQKQENILHMLPDSRYINTLPIKQTNEQLLKPRDDISEYIKHQPIQNIKKWEIKPEDRNSVLTNPNRFINSKPIINQPILKQEEETRLELEGISPEYMESLINQKAHESLSSIRSLQNSYQNINTPLEVTEEINNNQYNLRNQEIDKISTFRNPSAEILYKMQKALPYETESPSPGNNNFKSILNNLKRGQEFYTLPSSNKRYMVIYPNGNVEYVDQIAKIVENHPNYVMVKSEDYLKHLEDRSKMHSVPFIPQIKQNPPINTIQAAAKKQEYNVENHNLPEIKLDQAYSITENPAPYLDSSLITSNEKQDFTLTTTAPETYTIKNSPLASLIVNTVAPTSPQQIIERDNILNTVSSTLTPIETSTENKINKSDEHIIDKKLITKPIFDSETNRTVITESVSNNFGATNMSQQKIEQDNISNPDSQNITVSSILTPTETSTEDEDAFIIDEKLITKPITDSETNKTVITESISRNDTFKNSPLTPLIINIPATNVSQQEIEQNYVSNPVSYNITVSSILTPIGTSTENSINKSDAYIIDEKLNTKTTPGSETNNTEISEFDIQPQNIQNINHDEFNGEESYNTEISPRNHEVLPNNSSEIISTTPEYISDETSIEKQVTTTPLPLLDETKISKVSRSDFNNDTEVTSPSADNTYPESTSFSQDTEKADNSTGFWFEADKDFWDNIMTRNETQNQFYFIFVPPKPRIEKETKTTVFANGTTIEEVTETVIKDGEPEILRTTKITYANRTSAIV